MQVKLIAESINIFAVTVRHFRKEQLNCIPKQGGCDAAKPASVILCLVMNTIGGFHCVETLKISVDSYGITEIFNLDQRSRFH